MTEEQSGIADIAGFDRDVIDAWSRRRTEMHERAAQHQPAVNDQSAPTSTSLAVDQRATRTAKKSQPL
ncbi:MAG: relaxase domain-containing protein [Williamsia sp.]|nr:relaxase domain-containing protein [Williamsia sp.]